MFSTEFLQKFACCRRPQGVRRGGAAGAAVAGADPATTSFCWEATGVNTRENWKYVGKGKGEYEFVQMYNFVGEGVGTYTDAKNRNETPTTSRFGLCCRWGVGLVLLAGCVLGGAALLGVHILPLSSLKHLTSTSGARDTVFHSTAPESIPDGPKYNCVLNWPPNTWVDEKREWCCTRQSIACDHVGGKSKDGQDLMDPFNCQLGELPDWPKAEVQWCCNKKELGCSRMDQVSQ